MNKKRLLWRRLAMLALALVIAGIPLAEASADHGKKHHERRDYDMRERYEHYSHDEHGDDDDRDGDEVREVRFFVPGGAGFADGDTVTLIFPDGVSLQAVIHLKQGQPLIPAQQVLDALKVPYILYPKGTILEGFAHGKHFIFRSGKTVMYLNGFKRNMPTAASAMNDQFYIPLQAAAYVLGFTAHPDQQNNTIEFRTR